MAMEWFQDVGDEQSNLAKATSLFKSIRPMPPKLTTRASKITPTQQVHAAKKRRDLDVIAFGEDPGTADARLEAFETACKDMESKFEALSKQANEEMFGAVHGYILTAQEKFNSGRELQQIPMAVLCARGGFNSGTHTAPFAALAAYLRGKGFPAAVLQPRDLLSGASPALNSLLQQLSGLQTRADDIQALSSWYKDALSQGWLESSTKPLLHTPTPQTPMPTGVTPLLNPLSSLTLQSPSTAIPPNDQVGLPERRDNQGFKTPGPEHILSTAHARQAASLAGGGQVAPTPGEGGMLVSPPREEGKAATPTSALRRNLLATNFGLGTSAAASNPPAGVIDAAGSVAPSPSNWLRRGIKGPDGNGIQVDQTQAFEGSAPPLASTPKAVTSSKRARSSRGWDDDEGHESLAVLASASTPVGTPIATPMHTPSKIPKATKHSTPHTPAQANATLFTHDDDNYVTPSKKTNDLTISEEGNDVTPTKTGDTITRGHTAVTLCKQTSSNGSVPAPGSASKPPRTTPSKRSLVQAGHAVQTAVTDGLADDGAVITGTYNAIAAKDPEVMIMDANGHSTAAAAAAAPQLGASAAQHGGTAQQGGTAPHVRTSYVQEDADMEDRPTTDHGLERGRSSTPVGRKGGSDALDSEQGTPVQPVERANGGEGGVGRSGEPQLTPSPRLPAPGRQLRQRLAPGSYSESGRRQRSSKLPAQQQPQAVGQSTHSKRPVVVLVPEGQGMESGALQDLVLLLSERLCSFPVVLVMGMSSSVTAFYGSLPVDIMSRLSPQQFHLTPIHQRIQSCWTELVIGTCGDSYPHCVVGPNLASFLYNYLFTVDYSDVGLLRALRLALLLHFKGQPLAHLLPALKSGGKQALRQAIKELPNNVLVAAANQVASSKKLGPKEQRQLLEQHVLANTTRFLRWRVGLCCLMVCATASGLKGSEANVINTARMYCETALPVNLTLSGDITIIIRRLCQPKPNSLPNLTPHKSRALLTDLRSLARSALTGVLEGDGELTKFDYELSQLQAEPEDGDDLLGTAAIVPIPKDTTPGIATPTAVTPGATPINPRSDSQAKAIDIPVSIGAGKALDAVQNPDPSHTHDPTSHDMECSIPSPTPTAAPTPGPSKTPTSGSRGPRRLDFTSPQSMGRRSQATTSPDPSSSPENSDEGQATPTRPQTKSHTTPVSGKNTACSTETGTPTKAQTNGDNTARASPRTCNKARATSTAASKSMQSRMPSRQEDCGGEDSTPSAENKRSSAKQKKNTIADFLQGNNNTKQFGGVTPLQKQLDAALSLASPMTTGGKPSAGSAYHSVPNPRQRGAKLAALALQQAAASSASKGKKSSGSQPSTPAEPTPICMILPPKPSHRPLAVRLAALLLDWLPRLLKSCPFELPGKEAFCFDDVAAVQSLLLACPRLALLAALTQPADFLPIAEGAAGGSEDVCTAYSILEELPDSVDIGTWFARFCLASNVDVSYWAPQAASPGPSGEAGPSSSCSRQKQKAGRPSSSKSRCKAAQGVDPEEADEPSEEQTSALVSAAARFCQAARELQVIGLWRLPRQRKSTQTVQKAWSLKSSM